MTHIEGRNGQACAVITTDGRSLPADLVVYGIGVLPNVALAAEAGLMTDTAYGSTRTC